MHVASRKRFLRKLANMKQTLIIYLIALIFLQHAFCFQSSFFRLEHDDTTIVKTNDVKPFLNKTVGTEVECNMKCLNNKDRCCVIELKNIVNGPIQCLLYEVSLINLRKVSAMNSKIMVPADRKCKFKKIPEFKSCFEWFQAGWKKDDVYKINLNGTLTEALCDMTGGGWTIFQRRYDGSVDFSRNWTDYKHGFGDTNGEYWLGNDYLHMLTNKPGGVSIRIKSTDFTELTKFIVFDNFKIDDEENKYMMHVGDAVEGDQYLTSNQKKFKNTNGMYFTTADRDNDQRKFNCATEGGAYWHNKCAFYRPNSKYPKTSNCDECMRISYWKIGESPTPMRSFEMAIR